MIPPRHYRLAHQDSHLGVAYFSPAPVNDLPLTDGLEQLQSTPNDEFLRAHVRPALAALGEVALLDLYRAGSPTIRALIAETVLLAPALRHLLPQLAADLEVLRDLSPQIFLDSVLLPDHDRHAALSATLGANIFEHQPIADFPVPDDLSDKDVPCAPNNPLCIARTLPELPPLPRRPARDTHAVAMERLYGLGILDGAEMRHHASLAPWGLLRSWRLDRVVRCGSFDYRLDGLMTSYGRGLSMDDARVSLAMEIVERYSSFADIRDMRVSGSQDEARLVVATHSELGETALDPNRMRLEAPYRNQPLHWMVGCRANGTPLLVPVQSVYLFTNLDEKRLFSGLGSTGLASGNTPEEAKVSGLLEVIERDSEAAAIYAEADCFRITSRDPDLSALLERYRLQGIDPIFQDLTTELGVPCYKCFVLLREGGLVKATGASLSGPRALVSALTETPFPFPQGPASAAGPQALPVRVVEDLPDYSTGSARGDLALLEALLNAQGLEAVYVNLTKREVRLPVYRSIVPGLEIVSDFDQFTRVSPRLWRKVLKAKGTV